MLTDKPSAIPRRASATAASAAAARSAQPPGITTRSGCTWIIRPSDPVAVSGQAGSGPYVISEDVIERHMGTHNALPPEVSIVGRFDSTCDPRVVWPSGRQALYLLSNEHFRARMEDGVQHLARVLGKVK